MTKSKSSADQAAPPTAAELQARLDQFETEQSEAALQLGEISLEIANARAEGRTATAEQLARLQVAEGQVMGNELVVKILKERIVTAQAVERLIALEVIVESLDALVLAVQEAGAAYERERGELVAAIEQFHAAMRAVESARIQQREIARSAPAHAEPLARMIERADVNARETSVKAVVDQARRHFTWGS